MTSSAPEFILDTETQYVLTSGDEPEGCVYQGALYAWPAGTWEPDFTKKIGSFNGDVLIIDERRAGRLTGNTLSMFDGRQYLLSERDLHED